MLTSEDKKQAITELEWEMFRKVKNRGGRAECQENRAVFFIMRMSQYAPWPDALLDSYMADLSRAKVMERNMVAEKYAWMMEVTAPAEFEAIRDMLPPLSEKKEVLIREIVAEETRWFEEYAARYPLLASGNRKGDAARNAESLGGTSMPVYLKGELRTYSLATLRLYLDMVHDLKEKGQNPGIMIMDDQMKRLGYRDIEDAENSLGGQNHER